MKWPAVLLIKLKVCSTTKKTKTLEKSSVFCVSFFIQSMVRKFVLSLEKLDNLETLEKLQLLDTLTLISTFFM